MYRVLQHKLLLRWLTRVFAPALIVLAFGGVGTNYSEAASGADLSTTLRPIGGSKSQIQAPESIATGVNASKLVDAAGGIADGGSVHAVVRPFESATISSELNARILSMPFREGQHFKAGDVLVKFDCAKTEAELREAQAVLEANSIAYARQRKLLSYRATGSFSVDEALHQMKKAKAAVEGLALKRTTCQILAPYDGLVMERHAQPFEVAQTNQPLLKIGDDQKLELIVMVPSVWLRSLRSGDPLVITIDETGLEYRADISAVGGAIDPISQSARVMATLSNHGAEIVPGMSATVRFEDGTAPR